LSQGLPIEICQRPQILSIQPQNIEHLIDDVREHGAELVAEPVEIAQAVLAQRHDLAVQNGTLDPQLGQRFRNRTELQRPVVALAREHLHALSFGPYHEPYCATVCGLRILSAEDGEGQCPLSMLCVFE